MRQVITITGEAEVTVFYMATCLGCDFELRRPFYDKFERDGWAGAHRLATQHRLLVSTEIRIVSGDSHGSQGQS